MKLNFILDLDQTIISSEELVSKSKNKDKVIFNFQVGNKKKSIPENEIGKYHILDQFVIVERPYLQKFLDYLFANFNVSVWTAASEEYGRFICQNIILTKPERKLNYFLYLKHCKMSSKEAVKNLKFLYQYPGFEEKNTILLDDSELHIGYTLENSERIIKAKEYFFFEKKDDDFLIKLIARLKENKKNNIQTLTANINHFFKN
jgi:TFIIF-interacting CTD phosphatase-like protein